jgi:WD domain, G-beta repeat.
LNNQLGQKIITPRVAELVSSSVSEADTKKGVNGQVQAEIQSNNISGTRLTCCCEFENYIICAGFSGELLFVEKDNLCVKRKDRISNSIIRCLKVIYSEKALLVSTDAGEIIVYNLEHNIKQYYEHSNSPVYNIALRNSRDFITSERNGNIFEWQYIPNVGVFRNKKIFTTGNPVFAMDIIETKLIVVNSLGKKYEYDFLKTKLKSTSICDSNVFCLKKGLDDALYYGLSTGAILFEEPGCDVVTLDSHQDAVRDIVLSANKKWMFSVSKDRTVRAWHNGIPKVLTRVKDYLYQIIFEESNSCLYYVDGYGDIGFIHFSSDIDLANDISIVNN